jgi:hypothetical protein
VIHHGKTNGGMGLEQKAHRVMELKTEIPDRNDSWGKSPENPQNGLELKNLGH